MDKLIYNCEDNRTHVNKRNDYSDDFHRDKVVEYF